MIESPQCVILHWIWSHVPCRHLFEHTGLKFHSIIPERRLCSSWENVLLKRPCALWDERTIEFGQHSQTCLFLIVDKYFILHFKFTGATKSLKMKKNSIWGCCFAGLFLRTHLFSFCSVENEASWQLASDSSSTAAAAHCEGEALSSSSATLAHLSPGWTHKRVPYPATGLMPLL